MRPGIVKWIGLRPARRQTLIAVTNTQLDPAAGLTGDHDRSCTNQARQVTLIQSAHIAVVAGYLGLDSIHSDRLRRNIVVSGINLLALRGGVSGSVQRSCW